MQIQTEDTAVPRAQRRRFTSAFKREIVSQCLQPGASVSAIALAHGLNTNQVFKWRRLALREQRPEPRMLEIQVQAPEPEPQSTAAKHAGPVELVLSRGIIRLSAPVELAVLNALMMELIR